MQGERGGEGRERFGKGRENYQRHLTCSSGNFSPHSSYVCKIRNNIQNKEQQHVAFKHRVTNIVFVGVGGWGFGGVWGVGVGRWQLGLNDSPLQLQSEQSR